MLIDVNRTSTTCSVRNCDDDKTMRWTNYIDLKTQATTRSRTRREQHRNRLRERSTSQSHALESATDLRLLHLSRAVAVAAVDVAEDAVAHAAARLAAREVWRHKSKQKLLNWQARTKWRHCRKGAAMIAQVPRLLVLAE